MSEQTDYKVDVEVFEGPLDLLLYLIKKEEVDIYNIPIETITTQYVEYLNVMKMLDLNIAGEFLVMAATLMLIKSRMLLPEDQRPEVEGEEEEDPRWDLVRQLVEYKKFKDAALHLQRRELDQENIFGVGLRAIGAEADDSGVSLHDVSLFDLITAFNEVLKRTREEEIGQIFGEQFTVADKIEVIIRTLRERRKLPFSQLFGPECTRQEVICTFLGLLELIRLRQVVVTQSETFGEIVIGAAEEPAEVAE